MSIRQSVIRAIINLFPEKLLKVIALNSLDRISFDSYKFKLSFSQQGEDIFLQNIFTKKKGFYIDIGAFHPLIYSNTHVFYLRGWKGINIEPNPDNIAEFNKIRKRDLNLNLSVYSEEGKLTYYKFNHGAVNTLNKEYALHWTKEPGYIIEQKLEVQSKKLTTILEQHLPKNQDIDFLSVDCEGADLEVLRSNNWDLFRPKIVIVEVLYYEYPNFRESELFKYMLSKDYDFHGIMGISMFFIDRNKI